MVCMLTEFLGDDFVELLLNGERRASGCEASTVSDPEYVCVYGDGRLAEGRVENDVGGLTADARQGLERLAAARHAPVMLA